MEIFSEYALLIVGAVLVNNFVLTKFLGICPFLGVSKKVETAIGMTYAVIFVMALASLITWLVNRFLLMPLDLAYLQTLSFILIIAALVQFIEMVIKKVSPNLYAALGIYLPLITTNCAVLGVALINVQLEFNLIKATLYGTAAGAGFGLVLILFAGIRERLAYADVPVYFKGSSISLITSGLLSLAFMGFAGLVK
ncbi:MAG: electron transport complex subunit RsxA [Magnetococcales bacterium]|nr:electron transport complex subunit RsxA [Magnetococcales bacterium]NGZ25451.1 electron transport complex subunit RsxA [Magnetococcales bacterium]